MTTETKILALAELKERRQVLAFEVEQGRDGAVQELEVEQLVGALNQQQERADSSWELPRARLGADRTRFGAPAAAATGPRGVRPSGTAQTMANDPMKPLPIRRYEMTIDPKAKVRS